jgi:hypothetical protein
VGFTLLNITITINFIITLIQQFVMVFCSALTVTGNSKYLYLTALNTALCLSPSSDWSLPAYLSRSDPTALGTLKRFPISGSSVLGTGISSGSGSGSGGWKEVGSHPPPARSSGSKHRPVLSIQSSPGLIINSSSEADMSGLTVKKVDVVEVLVKKCLHLIGYVEGAGAMTSSAPHQSLPAGPPGFNGGNGSGVSAYTATFQSGHGGSGVAGGGFVRVGGMWNGDGQNSAVCLATIHSLGILTEV